jgi:hypothetical protein
MFGILAKTHMKYNELGRLYIYELSYFDIIPNSKIAHTFQYQTHRNMDTGKFGNNVL